MRKIVSSAMLALILMGTLTIAFSIRPVKAEPRTIIVPDEYPTIQAAISAANFGDTIYVKSGIYYENIIVNKTVILKGENKDTTIIDGLHRTVVVSIEADGVVFEGFTVQNGASPTLPGMQHAGIGVRNCSNVRIFENIITGNDEGVWLLSTSNCTVSQNIIVDNYVSGIKISKCRLLGSLFPEDNIVSKNTIKRNRLHGIFLSYTNSNIITENIVESNGGSGIWAMYSFNNIVYHNNLINNEYPVSLWESTNVWDNGYPSGGNYWSDYMGVDYYSGPNQDQPGSDGIGDTPYVIDENNRDRYPLMNPWMQVPQINHPRPEISLEIQPLSDGLYQCRICLRNLGEDSLYLPPPYWTSGVHIQLLGANIVSIDKGDFEKYLTEFEYPLKIKNIENNEIKEMLDYVVIEFYRSFIRSGELVKASFVVSVQGLAVIGYRAWIYDKNDIVVNEVEVHNKIEHYIARDPYDYPYNRHIHNYSDTGAIFKDRDGFYYVNFTFLDYKCYFKTIPTDWAASIKDTLNAAYLGKGVIQGWKKGDIDANLKNLWEELKITEVYLNVANIASGEIILETGTEDFIKLFKSNQYGKNIRLLAIVNMGYYECENILLNGNENLWLKIARKIATKIFGYKEFDGIHCDFEFYAKNKDEQVKYDEALVRLLSFIRQSIGSKILSVYIPTGDRWYEHTFNEDEVEKNLVTEIGRIADEVVPDVYGGRSYMYLGEIEHAKLIYYTYSRLLKGVGARLIMYIPACNMFKLDGINEDKNPDKRQKLAYALVGVELGHLLSSFLQGDWLQLFEKPRIALYHYTDMTTYDCQVFKQIWLPSYRKIKVTLRSSADLHLYDEQGRHVGVNYVNGQVEVQIPGANYTGPLAEPQTICLNHPANGIYKIEVVGKSYGNFSVEVEGFCNENKVFDTYFNATAKEGILYSLDLNITSGPTPLIIETSKPQMSVIAKIDIDPNSINLIGKGKWITAYIELPEGFNVADINASSILLNGTIPAALKPIAIGDYDNDKIPDLMVKFDRAKVIGYILNNVDLEQLLEERFMKVTLTVTGYLNDGTPFQGTNTIKIFYFIPRI